MLIYCIFKEKNFKFGVTEAFWKKDGCPAFGCVVYTI